MMTLAVISLALCVIQLIIVDGVINIPASRVGNNYASNISVNGQTFLTVVDTGAPDIVVTSEQVVNGKDTCYALLIDGTQITYSARNCSSSTAFVALEDASASVSVTNTSAVSAQNILLHPWNLTNGDLGLSYCSPQPNCGDTPFQVILANSTSDAEFNQTFGLKFSSVNGSLDLGGVSPDFQDSIAWVSQPAPSEADYLYHEFFLQNLRFCGQQILGNVSRTYPVMVDTGASCLTLPAEIYTHFTAWLTNGSWAPLEAWALPAFTFEVVVANGQSQTMYIPIGNLLLDPGMIMDEQGAPTVFVISSDGAQTVQEKRLCVLEGASLGDPYSYPAPNIVFGALPLQSLYLAGDFKTYSVGLASTLSTGLTSYYDSVERGDVLVDYCASAASCIGWQVFHPASNTCKAPNCDQYFFTELDHGSQTCSSQRSAYIAGVFFVTLIVMFEVTSFFIAQHTSAVLHDPTKSITATQFPTLTMYNHYQEAVHRGGNSAVHIGYGTVVVGFLLARAMDILFGLRTEPPAARQARRAGANNANANGNGNNNNNNNGNANNRAAPIAADAGVAQLHPPVAQVVLEPEFEPLRPQTQQPTQLHQPVRDSDDGERDSTGRLLVDDSDGAPQDAGRRRKKSNTNTSSNSKPSRGNGGPVVAIAAPPPASPLRSQSARLDVVQQQQQQQQQQQAYDARPGTR